MGVLATSTTYMSRTHFLTCTTLPTLQWDVYCRVNDNVGDIGVCWRLATQLAGQG